MCLRCRSREKFIIFVAHFSLAVIIWWIKVLFIALRLGSLNLYIFYSWISVSTAATETDRTTEWVQENAMKHSRLSIMEEHIVSFHLMKRFAKIIIDGTWLLGSWCWNLMHLIAVHKYRISSGMQLWSLCLFVSLSIYLSVSVVVSISPSLFLSHSEVLGQLKVLGIKPKYPACKIQSQPFSCLCSS